jgi:hypothetical protein
MGKLEFKGLNKLIDPESGSAETEPCFDWVSWQHLLLSII